LASGFWGFDVLEVWVKRMVVKAARRFVKVVPRVRPGRPVGQLVVRLFNLLRDGLELHDPDFYRDGNFPDLLMGVERVLLYLSEVDGHYAGWLAEAMLLCHDLVEESRRRFPAGADGDVAWLEWMSRHPIAKFRAAER
jgi:hypothetical protein